MAPGSVVVLHSTIHPETCRRLQHDFAQVHFLDAPVSGGGHTAAAGTLLVMVGGPLEIVDRCRPIFATYGNPVVHVGALGAGQEAKLLNNAVFTAQLALAVDAFDLAASRDLDQEAIATILAHGSGRSYAADVVAGGGFTLDVLAGNAGALLAKDVRLVSELAGDGQSTLLAAARAAIELMAKAK
jgi:3-hydroxyisobutyrate dehydrogenase-like beta-hydroxyacid dehydrogenase